MELRQLQAFVTLAESLSYREASVKLFITQPALTKQIKALEQSLGAPLFNRGRQGAQLTPFGQELYEKAYALVLQAKEFKQYAGNLVRQVSGHIGIGYGLSSIKMASMLTAQFKKQYPNVTITLDDMTSAKHTEGLLTNRLQLAFLRYPIHADLKSITLLKDNLVLVVNSHLYTDSGISKGGYSRHLDKLSYIQITPESCPGFSRQIEKYLTAQHVVPNVIQYVSDTQTLLALVASGMGAAIVQRSAIHIAPETIDIIDLTGEHASWSIGLCWNPRFSHPVRDVFLNMVEIQGDIHELS
ncbi:LysR family transcriptional regulator [Budvicia diplopodorum]|uniref:LysR family transcriptional regulator n=1 Tax=Budvicia diplopodorum TaxID=1119056 RepID=UPI00135782EA|nr:LysR family transcriptional regulator [Budvicia diplopodorum]